MQGRLLPLPPSRDSIPSSASPAPSMQSSCWVTQHHSFADPFCNNDSPMSVSRLDLTQICVRFLHDTSTWVSNIHHKLIMSKSNTFYSVCSSWSKSLLGSNIIFTYFSLTYDSSENSAGSSLIFYLEFILSLAQHHQSIHHHLWSGETVSNWSCLLLQEPPGEILF